MDKLVDPLSSHDFSITDYQAATDRIALYQSLRLLMPKAALDEARKSVSSKSKAPKEIAEWACMPIGLVQLMPGDDRVDINGDVYKL